MRALVIENVIAKIFSANITADEPAETIARARYVLSQSGTLLENFALGVDGYVAGGTSITAARRDFPRQLLHDLRWARCGDEPPDVARLHRLWDTIKRVIGASGIHLGAIIFGKMEGDASYTTPHPDCRTRRPKAFITIREWERKVQPTPNIFSTTFRAMSWTQGSPSARLAGGGRPSPSARSSSRSSGCSRSPSAGRAMCSGRAVASARALGRRATMSSAR